MRILHVVPLMDPGAAYGGPARGTLKQSVRLGEAGHHVTILSLAPSARQRRRVDDRVDLITFRAWSLPRLHRFATLFSLRAVFWILVNARRYDVVHFHSGREVWVLLAQIAARTRRVRYVVQTHGMLRRRDALVVRIFDLLLLRGSVGGAGCVMYLTDTERRDLSAWAWMPPLVKVINGVDRIDDAPVASRSQGPLRITCITRLHPRKRVDDLVRGFSKALAECGPLELTIYGPDEGALTDVMATIRDMTVADRAQYGGALPYDAVHRALRESDVFVLPSIAEPFPNSLMEALAAGLPTISTTQCGLAPYIRRHQAGLIVEPGADAIASALTQLATSPELRAQLAEAALSLCRKEFSMDTVYAQLMDAYRAGSDA